MSEATSAVDGVTTTKTPDPEWVENLNALTKLAAEKLDCMVCIVAVQPGGSVAVTVDGVPKEGGVYANFAERPDELLASLAFLAKVKRQLNTPL